VFIINPALMRTFVFITSSKTIVAMHISRIRLANKHKCQEKQAILCLHAALHDWFIHLLNKVYKYYFLLHFKTFEKKYVTKYRL